MTEPSASPVFIVGCPRSGTTWLYHILLSAGRFAIYRSETQIYTSFAPRYGNFVSSGGRSRFLRRWLASEYFRRSGLSPDIFYDRAMAVGSSPGAMLRLFMDEISIYQKAARWAECTPDNALHLAAIMRDFPEALFIHLVRDGRDVALSLARKNFIRPLPWHRRRPEIAAAAYWRWVVDNVDRRADALQERLLTLRYEDLVTDYRGSLSAVSRFIQQPIDIEKVSRASIGSVAKPNSSFAEDGESAAASFVGRWRALYGPAQLEAVENIAGATLARHGYEPAASRRRRSTIGALPAAVYPLKFRLSVTTKARTLLGRLTEDRFSSLPDAAPCSDPTLRPGDHPDEIRNLVGR